MKIRPQPQASKKVGREANRRSGAEKPGELLHGARPALSQGVVERGKEVALGLGAVERPGFDGDEGSPAFARVVDEGHGGSRLRREVVKPRERRGGDFAGGVREAADELEPVGGRTSARDALKTWLPGK